MSGDSSSSGTGTIAERSSPRGTVTGAGAGISGVGIFQLALIRIFYHCRRSARDLGRDLHAGRCLGGFDSRS